MKIQETEWNTKLKKKKKEWMKEYKRWNKRKRKKLNSGLTGIFYKLLILKNYS